MSATGAWELTIRYKYTIDVDGYAHHTERADSCRNGWSSRFRRLLRGNNVVLKSTLYVSNSGPFEVKVAQG